MTTSIYRGKENDAGALREDFEKWCAENCSSGANHSAWYWRLYQAGAEAGSAHLSTALTEAEGKIAALEQDAGRWQYVFPLFWFRMAVITHFGKIGNEVVDINAAIDAARSEGGKPK